MLPSRNRAVTVTIVRQNVARTRTTFSSCGAFDSRSARPLSNIAQCSQLAAVEARGELARINAGRTRALVATDALPRSQQDSDDAVVKTSKSDLEFLRAQIARKIVRAPFGGKLGCDLGVEHHETAAR